MDRNDYTLADIRDDLEEGEEFDLEATLKHRAECPHDDCLCRSYSGEPGYGEIVMAGNEPGIIVGKERNGMIDVKWGEYWTQGYPRDRFILVGDHWEVADA